MIDEKKIKSERSVGGDRRTKQNKEKRKKSTQISKRRNEKKANVMRKKCVSMWKKKTSTGEKRERAITKEKKVPK